LVPTSSCRPVIACQAGTSTDHLLELILRKRIRRLVLTHKGRLLRFGSELIFALCEIQNIEIVIINTSALICSQRSVFGKYLIAISTGVPVAWARARSGFLVRAG
jgi:hypothetical protein